MIEPLAPEFSALQRAWLRELGVPKALLPAAGTAAAKRAADGPTRGTMVNGTSEATTGKAVTGEATTGEAMTGQATTGEAMTGEATSGQATSGQATSGQATSGQATSGQATSGQATTGQATTGQATAVATTANDATIAARSVHPVVESQTVVPAVVPRQPAATVERADMAELRRQVQSCEACQLHDTRRHAVFGSGPEQAEWMIVGEAPGENEDHQGEPFVGKSGELLAEMLRAIGLRREDVFIANVIKCRPPGNRNPRPDEIEVCKPFLLRQIQIVQPRRLVTVGRFAAQVLLGAEGNLHTLRGQVHTLDDGQGRQIPLVASYHPAYLLRSPQEKAKAWRDLMLAARHSPQG